MIITKILLEQLKKLEKFTEPNGVIPETACFLFKNGNIYASNLNSYAVAENVIDPNLTLAIDAKTIMPLLQNISDYALTIETDDKNGILIKTDRGTYKTVGMDVDKFPVCEFPDESSLTRLPINLNTLNLRYLSAGLAKDPLREQMNHFSFYLNNTDFACFTTNAQIIIYYTTAPLNKFDVSNAIIVSKELLKVPLDSDVTVYKNNTYLFIDGLNYKYAVRLIDAKAITIAQVIPSSEAESKVTFSIPSVLNILNRIKSTSKQPNIHFKADANKQAITFYFIDVDFNSEFKESIKANITGKSFIANVNLKDLISLCNPAFKSISIENRAIDSTKPLVCKVGEYDTVLVQMFINPDAVTELNKEEALDLFTPISIPEPVESEEDYEMHEEEEEEQQIVD